MKFSSTFALAALAPLAMAGHRSFRPAHRDVDLDTRGVEPLWSTTGGEDSVVQMFKRNMGMGAVPASAPAAPGYPASAPAPAPAAGDSAMPAMPMAPGATHHVVVGGPSGLVFTPETINGAKVGDMVVFQFMSKNHTVTQSTFDKPCSPMTGGLDSGFVPNPDNTIVPAPQLALQVTTTKPLWFYCAQGNHCGKGMVFSINPTAEKSAEKFKQLAGEQGAGAAPPAAGTTAPAAASPTVVTPPPMQNTPAAGAGAESPPPMNSPAAPVETPAAAPPAAGGATQGQGQVVDGTCVCMVQCPGMGMNSFPAANQGVGAYGGQAGSMRM